MFKKLISKFEKRNTITTIMFDKYFINDNNEIDILIEIFVIDIIRFIIIIFIVKSKLIMMFVIFIRFIIDVDLIRSLNAKTIIFFDRFVKTKIIFQRYKRLTIRNKRVCVWLVFRNLKLTKNCYRKLCYRKLERV